MNSLNITDENLNIDKLTRAIFITIAFTIILSFSVLVIIDDHIQNQSSLVDHIVKIEHNTSNLEHALHNLKPNDFSSKKNLSDKTDKLNHSLELLLNKKINWSLTNINDSSLYYFSPDSNYTKDEVLLIHMCHLYKRAHKNLNFLTHDEISKDSLFRSYEDFFVWDEEEQKEKVKILGIERHKTTLTKKAKRKIESIYVSIEKVKEKIIRLSDHYNRNLKKDTTLFNNTLYISILINFTVLFISFTLIKKKIISPITYINNKLLAFNKGEFHGKIKVTEKNELGKIQVGINKLVNTLLVANEFVRNIKNKSVTEYNKLKSSDNPLLQSLKEMSEELEKEEIEEKERNWIIEGQAEFSELLSKHTNNFQNLVDAIISNLVKYIGGLQGAIFIINDEEKILELVSSFAYDRKKFISKKVEIGEGLVGQAWLEEKYIQLDNIPEEHTKIKSGMGEAKPKNILIVPLIDNQKVYGIIELGSFSKIEEYQREFVLRISENIAATLSSVEVNNKTQKLLAESQLLTEKMKEQEEEMLQNLEELQATQEDITRKEFLKEQELKGLSEKLYEKNKESKKKESKLNAKINKLEIELEESKEDNEKIRELEANISTLEEKLNATVEDLNETIRMKDLKIEKLKKRMERPKE